MEIVTLSINSEIHALTIKEAQTDEGKELLKQADDWVWQDQPNKDTAIKRHNEALDAWQVDNETGRELGRIY